MRSKDDFTQFLDEPIINIPEGWLEAFASIEYLNLSLNELQALAEEDSRHQQIFESITIWQEATLTPSGDEPTGAEWEVTIIGPKTPDDLVTIEGKQFIRSKNGRLYDIVKLRDSVPQWEGIKVYDNHLTDEEFERRQGMRSVDSEWLGTIVNPFWDEAAKAIKGIFKVVKESLATKLLSAFKAGVLNTIGLSIDTFPIINSEANLGGKRLPIIEGFKKILSVDLVAEPAAGGSLDRLLAANNNIGDGTMELTLTDEVKDFLSQTVKSTLTAALDEIVVVGYGTQERAKVTGAISTVSSEEINALPHSVAHFSLFMGFEGDIEDAGATRSNHWIYPSGKVDVVWTDAPQSPPEGMFVSFASLKDRSDCIETLDKVGANYKFKITNHK